MKRFWIIWLMGGVSCLLSHGAVYGQPTLGFTQEDRERIIRLETTLTLFMEATDQRFIELREDMNKRFEQVDQRFIELREDMNNRSKQVDKRFVELREDMNNRFEQMMNTLQLIAGIFTVLTLGVIGFAYWDRRTIIRKANKRLWKRWQGRPPLKNKRQSTGLWRKRCRKSKKTSVCQTCSRLYENWPPPTRLWRTCSKNFIYCSFNHAPHY